MFTAARISKTTFFAAATLGLASVLFAAEETGNRDWTIIFDNDEVATFDENLTFVNDGFGSFVKTGSGTLILTKLGIDGVHDGDGLYGRHALGGGVPNGAYIQYNATGGVVNGEGSYHIVSDGGLGNLLGWESGELRVEEGQVFLQSYVNAWVDYGSLFNNFDEEQNWPLNGAGVPKMAGATQVTVAGGARLYLSDPNYTPSAMLRGGATWVQFLHNLNAVDSNVSKQRAADAWLDLGSSTSLAVNIHIDAWEDNECYTQSVDGTAPTFADTALAFGGSIGVLAGKGDVYKTGEGAFTILTGASSFSGDLYAAGGELVLSATDTASGGLTFKDVYGNEVRALYSNSLANVGSVNIAGRLADSGSIQDTGSRQGAKVAVNTEYSEALVPVPGTPEQTKYVYVKEAYFTPPSAGTLVVAENQLIKNFQSDFNGGYNADGKSVENAIFAAGNSTDEAQTTAPMIVGTGIGSQVVIPGGIFKKDSDGNYTKELIVDGSGYITGGLLVVDQDAGMGGIYEGSIVGCRVSIYKKSQLGAAGPNENNEARLEKAQITEFTFVCNTLGVDVKDLNVAPDGSFALDNEAAQKVVEYYKNLGSDFYVDYQADADVAGGLVYLKGAGDLALLLSNSNYSGVYIDPSRTGKTVFNIVALNNVTGRISNLGSSIVSIVATNTETLGVKFEFGEDSRLVFSTIETIGTKSGAIKVGGDRQAIIGVNSNNVIQDEVLGAIYVERGTGLALSGDESAFPNATSLTLWKGPAGATDASAAASSLSLAAGSAQVIRNLTGDSTATVELNTGSILTANITSNAKDNYSELILGSYDGALSGAGRLVKAGEGKLTIGGGENTGMFYGSTEVAEGSVEVSRANGLTGSSAVILNAGTTVTMKGNQSIRNLFGEKSTLTPAEGEQYAYTLVVEGGTLTLGSNDDVANGEIRPDLATTLGTGIDDDYKLSDTDKAFARFENTFDSKGNLIEVPTNVEMSQAEWTEVYLELTAKLAYSGFETSALSQFVDNGVLSAGDLANITAFAKSSSANNTVTVTVGEKECEISQGALLANLGTLYATLDRESVYRSKFSKNTADGFYDASGVYDAFLKYSTRADYEAFKVKFDATKNSLIAAGKTIDEVNAELYKKLTTKLDELEGYDDNAAQAAANVATANFSGIKIVGAFANEVDSEGNLADSAWIEDLAFAGNLKTDVLRKVGDNTSKLTGTLNTTKIVVNGGTLELNHDTIVKDVLTDGIVVTSGANYAVAVEDKDADIAYDYAISGDGNFVKLGDGKLTLGTDVLYSGTTTIQGGTLQMMLRNVLPQENGLAISPQSHIFLAGDDVTLILNQTARNEVVWGNNITTAEEDDENGNPVKYSGVTIKKIGTGDLTVGGNVSFGSKGTLSVEEGKMTLSGELELGTQNAVSVAKGATLSLAEVDCASGSVNIAGEGALITTDKAEFRGVGEQKFTGTLRIASGALTLSGESVFANAKEIMIGAGASLNVADKSDQTVRALSGATNATLNVEADGRLVIDRSDSGTRLEMDYTTGIYTFDDVSFFNAPNYTGNIEGDGVVMVSGAAGTQRFSGTITSTIAVDQDSQVILDVDGIEEAKLEILQPSVPYNTTKLPSRGELVFYVASDTASVGAQLNGVYAAGGSFGKVGGGTLEVASDYLEGVEKINVYEGNLKLDEWVDGDKLIASGAQLTVAMSAASSTSLDLTEVMGSGLLNVTTTEDISFTIGGNGENAIKSLPTYSKDGKFFNGTLSFSGNFSVTLEDTTLTSVNTSEEANLSISSIGGVTLVQAQNSVIAGNLSINGDLKVQGMTSNSGNVLHSDLRRLDVVKDLTGELVVENVGFGFNSGSNLAISISKESVSNAFFVNLDSDSSQLVGSGTSIGGGAWASASDEYKLKHLSVVKSGTGTLKLTSADFSKLGPKGSDDTIFGFDTGLYSILEHKNGTMLLGVDQGTIEFIGDLGENGLKTGNGLNVDLGTFRSATKAVAGTISIKAEPSGSKTFATTTAYTQTLAETISGTGNVAFDGSGTTIVTAAQNYTGKTDVKGTVQFSGDGRTSRSSDVVVAGTGTLLGGVKSVGRNVDYTMNAVRNASDSGLAGSTTLTFSLEDERLPSAIRCQLEVSAVGELVKDANNNEVFEILGALPEGVALVSRSVSENGLTLTLKDAAFGNEEYSITVPIDTKAFPQEVGATAEGSGATTVAGNVTVSAGGKIVLDAKSGDSIDVGNGALNFADGGKLVIKNLNTSTLGTAVTVAKAAKVSYENLNVATDEKNPNTAAVVKALEEGYADGGMSKVMVYTDAATGAICATMLVDDFASLDVDYHDGISSDFLYALSELATNGVPVSSGVMNLDKVKDGAAKDLAFALNSLSSDALASEVNKLSPNAFASMMAMPVAAYNGDIARIHSRLDQRRYDGANPLHEKGDSEFFVFAQGDFAENDGSAESPTFDYNLHGVTAGYDWKTDPSTTMGFALGYTYGKAKIHDNGGKINMDEIRMTAFASRWFGNFYLDGGVQAGWATFDTRRNTITGKVSGDTDSLVAGAFATLGSVFVVNQNKMSGEGLYFTPSIGLSYLHSSIDGFSENGTAALVMKDADGDSLRLRVAAGLQWVVYFSDWQVRVGAELAYTRDFLGEELEMDGRFATGRATFRTSGNALPTDIISFMPTLDISLSERSSVYLGYGIEFDTDSGMSQNVNAGYRYRF